MLDDFFTRALIAGIVWLPFGRAVFCVIVMVMSIVGMTVISYRAVRMHDTTVRQMGVIVIVAVNCQSGSPAAEQLLIFGIFCDR